MRRPISAVVASVALAALFVAGCGSSSDSDSGGEEGTGKIATILPARSIPYYRDLGAGIEAEADKAGWESDLVYGDQSVETNLNQVETALATQPDGMIVAPVDQEALIPGYRQVSDLGIPIVTVSDNIGEDGRSYQLAYVGHDYEQLGRDKAQWIVDQLEGEGIVGMVHAIRGLNFTEEQNAGAMEVFGENPGITVVDGPYVGDFTSDLGLEGAENLLTREPDLDALYMDNDDLALGAIEAVAQGGFSQDDILIVGTDGGPPALEAVAAGDLDVTWSLCGYAQGVEAVQTVIDNIENGTEPPDGFVATKQLMLTQDTIKEETAGLTRDDCNEAVETVSG